MEGEMARKEAELARKMAELAVREAELARREAEANAASRPIRCEPIGVPMPSEPTGALMPCEPIGAPMPCEPAGAPMSAINSGVAMPISVSVYYSASNKRIMTTVLPEEVARARPMTREEAAEYCPHGLAPGFRAFLI